MKDLYTRFGLTSTSDKEEEKFRNKLENFLEKSITGSEILTDNNSALIWKFDNFIGEKHQDYYGSTKLITGHILGNRPLNEYLFRLQIIINLLWEDNKSRAGALSAFVSRFLEESTINLGYFVKFYKTKPPQILPAGNEKQKRKIISAIDRLEIKPNKYSATIDHFDAGIKELLTAKTKPQLKDVVEDMSTVCDSLAKIVFQDENLGFKHFFKDKRWQKAKLNDAQKKIYRDLNETIDQIKHDVIKSYKKEDVEIIVYLTSSFIEKVAR